MANVYDMSDTWNDGATTFTSIKMNVTDTASSASSLLLDLQVGGSSKFSVRKTGEIVFSGNSFAPKVIDASGSTHSGRATLAFKAGVMGVPSSLGQGFNFGTLPLEFGTNTTSSDLALFRDAANTLAQRNTTNAQTFNLYNTYTDASNYERGFMKWNSGNLEIGTEAAGTGSGRNINIVRGGANVLQITNIAVRFLQPPQPSTAGLVSLGESGKGWNSLYLQERAADPADPAEGESVTWQSNGTASGDDGDIMMKITAGGVTKTVTLVDFSAA